MTTMTDDDNEIGDDAPRPRSTGPTFESLQARQREFAARGQYLAFAPAEVRTGLFPELGAADEQQSFIAALAPLNQAALMSAETLYNLYLELRRGLWLAPRALEASTQGPTALDDEASSIGLKIWLKGLEVADAFAEAADALEANPETWDERTMRSLAKRVRDNAPDLDDALTQHHHRPGYTRPELRATVIAAYKAKYRTLSAAAEAMRRDETQARATAEAVYEDLAPGALASHEQRQLHAARELVESGTSMTPPGLALLQQSISREFQMFARFQELGPDHIAVARHPNLPPAL